MARVVRRAPSAPGTEIIEFDDGTSLTVPAGTAPQAQAQAPVAVQSQAQAPQSEAVNATRSQMTPYGLPLQDVQALASRPVYQPGRAAYDPKKVIANQVAVPTGVQTQVTGAKPFDRDTYEDAQAKEREAQQLKADADMLAASNDARTQQALASELQNINTDQQAKQRAAEDRYNAGMLQLTNEAKQVASKEVKVDRVFENMSGLQKMLFAISAGLFGGATHGRSNQTLDMMQNLMNADINAQQNQINREQGNADNALARLSQQWGSIEAGRSALKVQQMEVLKQKLVAQASEVGTARAKANADAQAKLLEAQQQRELAVLQSAARGQVTETTVAQMQVPVKGTAGGLRKPTEAEVDKRISREQGLRTSGGKIIETNLKNEGQVLENTGGGGKAAMRADDKVTEYGNKRAELLETINGAEDFLSRNAVQKDAQGNWVPTKGIPGIGFGTSVIPEAWDSDAGQTNLQQVRQIGAMGAKSIYGILTQAEKASFAEDFLPVGNERRLVKGVASIAEKAKAKLKDLDAAYGSQAVDEFERRRNEQQKRKTESKVELSEPQ